MFNGHNASNKEFDVIDEDFCVLESFTEWEDALQYGKATPWFAGHVRIRRDLRFKVVQDRPPFQSWSH